MTATETDWLQQNAACECCVLSLHWVLKPRDVTSTILIWNCRPSLQHLSKQAGPRNIGQGVYSWTDAWYNGSLFSLPQAYRSQWGGETATNHKRSHASAALWLAETLMNRSRNGWLGVQREETFHSAIRDVLFSGGGGVGGERKDGRFVAIFSCVYRCYWEAEFCWVCVWCGG